MIKRYVMLTGLIIVIMFLAGCAGNFSRLEMDHGISFNLAKFNQTLNPGAGEKSEPVCGLSGQAAQKAIEKYQTGFKTPASNHSFRTNIGK